MAVSRPTKSDAAVRAPRTRMTAPQRRAQLIEVARGLFAERGFEGTSIEEIAQRASVSKPIVYEHFGGKEGLYAVVVDREMETLLEMVTASLSRNSSLHRIQSVALALLTYMEERTDGFRILMRGESTSTGGFSSLLNDAISQVEHILAGEFDRRGFDPALAPMYAQALVGMVSVTAQWWLDVREPSKEVVAAHLVNLCWNGLARLNPNPRLISTDASGKRSSDTVADD
ncbi:TetR/AcrR family transcriptional regulator [Gordonia sp. (in: high G+C Gram-positive bacteria)]|uniref:TetR/AcrR family transcriptional regulator n=1 Tax=Gordonia sp. (in: high G+C Gram-positive bacteria) TaxID=84139 RepID=UPI001D6A0679|nr:TetR/AcrR family transcriptional regulator [Gordonia sp. (in: high G+C Gram-positive bacteria)]MCB1293581.1 TetR/AcrR family transcriptional regulator [Gordonia sp. (in: high G+C Gram-positive bacteria)]HMS77226.1 TetR/AcrR family transcriptional regulator [Gordonia sp. (in: high G+C Gram-positive bacteria)]HQV18356.1 TetR/AcrR family transcriptional regulator [Gordonia sp. (in: high G+C Gram-positive bacteria)]